MSAQARDWHRVSTMIVIGSWLESFRRTVKNLPLVWLLFGAVSGMSLIPTIPYFLKIRQETAQTGIWESLRRGLDFRWYSELRLGSTDFFTTLTQIESITIVFFLLISLFLSGGTVAALARRERPFRISGFTKECATLYPKMLGLFVVAVLFGRLIYRVHVWSSAIIVESTLRWDSELGVAGVRLGNDGLFIVLLLAGVLIFRYLRISVVLSAGTPFLEIWRPALKFVLRYPLHVIGVQVVGGMLWVLSATLFSQLSAVEVGGGLGIATWLVAGLFLTWSASALRVSLAGAEVILFERLGMGTFEINREVNDV